MILFISKYSNNVDKKGRISVPAAFRASLAGQKQQGLILYPSIKNQCIECCAISRLEQLAKLISNLDPYSAERDAFETIILGESSQTPIDNEGRIIIPKFLNQYAKITDQVVFVGKGQVFEIWNPLAFEHHLAQAKTVAKENKNILKNL